jgi:predicted short-subunit dehydrogenase-like oxidoreductase (DUF2520 family)
MRRANLKVKYLTTGFVTRQVLKDAIQVLITLSTVSIAEGKRVQKSLTELLYADALWSPHNTKYQIVIPMAQGGKEIANKLKRVTE